MNGQPSKKTIAKYMYMVGLEGRMWSEGEIVSFRSLLNTKLSNQPDVREMLLERFNASLDVAPFQLEKVQQIKGLSWLHKTQINKRGDLRAAKTTFIGNYELACIRDFSHFDFVGLRDVTPYSNFSGYKSYVPIYRLVSTSGMWFEYSANSSGACEVTNIGGPVERPNLKVV